MTQFFSCRSVWVWFKIRLYTENQHPRLPGSALKDCVVRWLVGSHSFLSPSQLVLRLSWTVTTIKSLSNKISVHIIFQIFLNIFLFILPAKKIIAIPADSEHFYYLSAKR